MKFIEQHLASSSLLCFRRQLPLPCCETLYGRVLLFIYLSMHCQSCFCVDRLGVEGVGVLCETGDGLVCGDVMGSAVLLMGSEKGVGREEK